MDQRQSKLTLASSCAIHGLQDGLTSSVNVLLPVLASHFGLNYAQVGLIRAAHSVAMSLLEFPSGVLAERWGERHLLVFGLSCAGLGYLCLSIADRFEVVLAALFLAGFGAAFQHSLNSSLVSRAFGSRDRPVALGTYNSAGDIGKLGATGLMSFLLGLGVGWQGLVVAYGAVALLAGLALWTVLRRAGIGAQPSRLHARGHTLAAAGSGIRDRLGFTALTGAVMLDTLVQDGFLVFVAFLMIEKEVPTGLAAFAIVLVLVGGVVGKFGCGFLARRLGTVPAFILVEALTASGIIAVYLAPPVIAFCLLPAVGLVLQGSSTITYGTVGDFVEESRRSRAFGIIYAMGSVAAVLGPLGFGFIGDQLGLGAAMLAMSLAVFLAIPVSLLLKPALARVGQPS